MWSAFVFEPWKPWNDTPRPNSSRNTVPSVESGSSLSPVVSWLQAAMAVVNSAPAATSERRGVRIDQCVRRMGESGEGEALCGTCDAGCESSPRHGEVAADLPLLAERRGEGRIAGWDAVVVGD